MKNIIVYISLIISVVSLLLSVKANLDLRNLHCALIQSIYAEREYTYPILRTIDNPDNYGKDIKNPITTNSKYFSHCE